MSKSPARILLFEDDPAARLAAAAHLADAGFDDVTTCGTWEQARALTESLELDLAILDIHVDERPDAGLALGERCRARGAQTIFTTGQAAHVEAAIAQAPAAVLFKPFPRLSLVSAVRLALRARTDADAEGSAGEQLGPHRPNAARSPYTFVHQGSAFLKIALADVLYIGVNDDTIAIHTYGGRYAVSSTLVNMHEQFPSPNFLRVGRSHVVNADAISRFDPKFLYLDDAPDPTRIRLSKSSFQALKARLHILTSK